MDVLRQKFLSAYLQNFQKIPDKLHQVGPW